MKKKTVMLSGGFDPIHIGHVRMILGAQKHGDNLVVALNSDDWLMRKKGYIFMPWTERAEIILAIRGVDKVVPVSDEDGSVCAAIREHSPDIFANGGDRKNNNTPEVSLCEQMSIDMIWNVGGEKIQSSSDLVTKSKEDR